MTDINLCQRVTALHRISGVIGKVSKQLVHWMLQNKQLGHISFQILYETKINYYLQFYSAINVLHYVSKILFSLNKCNR